MNIPAVLSIIRERERERGRDREGENERSNVKMRDNLNKKNKIYIFKAIFVTIRLGNKLCTILKGAFGWQTQARTIANDETVVDRKGRRIDVERNT